MKHSFPDFFIKGQEKPKSFKGRSMKKREKSSEKLYKLIEIGMALSSEKELGRLFNMILEKSTDLTQSETASLHLIKNKAGQKSSKMPALEKEPFFYLIKSYSKEKQFMDHNDFSPIKKEKILNSVVVNKEILNIPSWNQELNEGNGVLKKHFGDSYKLDSLLLIPMVTADKQVCGVLQLANKQDKNKNIPFNEEDEETMKIFSTYGAIALENAKLAENIENLFESFVRASIKAIESRDPTTSGHSDRVAMMTVELALATHKISEGPFKNTHFSEQQIKEIRYASLLHDFGKIGIKESILLKKKKLKDRDLQSILMRFDTMSYNEEKTVWKNLCEYFIEGQRKKSPSFDIDKAYWKATNQIKNIQNRIKHLRSHVITANEPQIMSEDFDINELIEKINEANDLFQHPIVKQTELKSLSIARGSLNDEERKEIQSHVSHTYEFLKQIAWTENLSHVPTIAHCHHEKLDGSGYPLGIKAEAIPIQSRMMTIADIYDALTAFDRPYKKQVSQARALEILIGEARAGKIDGHLLKIFIESGVFHRSTMGTIKKAS